MVRRILPLVVDNTYRGHIIGLWLLIPILIAKTGIALGAIFNGREAAQSADGIPLDTYGSAGAQAVVALFAVWGISQLVFSVLGGLVLVRYRALIPLLYGLLVVEHIARKWMLMVKPIERTGTTSGFTINLVLLGLMLLGLGLSLWNREGGAGEVMTLPSRR